MVSGAPLEPELKLKAGTGVDCASETALVVEVSVEGVDVLVVDADEIVVGGAVVAMGAVAVVDTGAGVVGGAGVLVVGAGVLVVGVGVLVVGVGVLVVGVGVLVVGVGVAGDVPVRVSAVSVIIPAAVSRRDIVLRWLELCGRHRGLIEFGGSKMAPCETTCVFRTGLGEEGEPTALPGEAEATLESAAGPCQRHQLRFKASRSMHNLIIRQHPGQVWSAATSSGRKGTVGGFGGFARLIKFRARWQKRHCHVGKFGGQSYNTVFLLMLQYSSEPTLDSQREIGRAHV